MHRPLKHNPLRILTPWVAVAVGLLMVVLYLGSLGAGEPISGLYILIGPGLIVMGIVAFFVYRWMAKRGL